MNFRESLDRGQAGESAISVWLRARGFTVMPVYEKILDTGKGPQLYFPDETVVAPDLFVFRGAGAYWIEAKTKTAFTWYRIGQRWTTGIDLHHYEQYKRVDDGTPWPVWLLFLQLGGPDKDIDLGPSPAGLFGQTLENLRSSYSHQSDNWGTSGMIYWAHDSLRKLASLEDVLEAIGKTTLAATS